MIVNNMNIVNNLIIVLSQKKYNFYKEILHFMKKENEFIFLSEKINV